MQHRAHRYRTQYPVEFRSVHGIGQAVVADVNNQGARLERIRPHQRGSKISFIVLGRPVDAVVYWSCGNQVGVKFTPAISDHILDTLRYRRDARQGTHRGTVGFGFAEMR